MKKLEAEKPSSLKMQLDLANLPSTGATLAAFQSPCFEQGRGKLIVSPGNSSRFLLSRSLVLGSNTTLYRSQRTPVTLI
jgi:hypothetical protein